MSQQEPSYFRDDMLQTRNILLNRRVYIEPDGTLTSEFSSWDHKTKQLLYANQWQFETDGQCQGHMASLDDHWQHISREFTSIAEYASRYADLKTLHNDDKIHAITAGTLKDLSQGLFHQYATDEEIAAGQTGDNDRRIPFSQRYMSVREQSYKEQVQYDAYEETLIGMCESVSNGINRYDNIIYGMDPDQNHLHSGEFPEDHPHDEPEEKGYGGMATAGDADHDEHEPWHQDADAWKRMADDDYDGAPGDSREQHTNQLISQYLEQMNSFIQAAEKIWLDTAQAIQQGEEVTLHEKEISAMKYWRDEAIASYVQLRDAMNDSSFSAFELDPVYECLEDPQNGPEAAMQKIISMASRPELLKDTISKELPRARQK